MIERREFTDVNRGWTVGLGCEQAQQRLGSADISREQHGDILTGELVNW